MNKLQKKLLNSLDPKREDHVDKYKYFNPSKSIKNVELYKEDKYKSIANFLVKMLWGFLLQKIKKYILLK